MKREITGRGGGIRRAGVWDGSVGPAGVFKIGKIGYKRPAMDQGYLMMLILMVGAYLVGAVPFGLLVGLTQGKDPRKFGSGNIGATNVARMLGGAQWFFVVFVLDLSKSLLPMLAAAWVVHHEFAGQLNAGIYLLWIGVGLAAIVGHMFSLFIGFKGGKGVATSCGVALGLFPFYTWAALVALGVWIITFLATRYISIASMVAAIMFPVAYVFIALLHGWPIGGQQWPLLGCAILVAGMVVYRHRDNIKRLRAGTEHRMKKQRGGFGAAKLKAGQGG